MAVFLDEEKCTGCGICVSNCRVQAITIEDDLAVIDQEKCTECLRCMDECPAEAFYQVLDETTPVPRRDKPPAVQNGTHSPPHARQSGDKIQRALSLGESIVRGISSVVQYFSRNDTPPSRRGTGIGRREKGRGRGIQRRRRGGRK
jgi:NAD-dependent dihydropyrimidine dehydrogenase PreA subunit